MSNDTSTKLYNGPRGVLLYHHLDSPYQYNTETELYAPASAGAFSVVVQYQMDEFTALNATVIEAYGSDETVFEPWKALASDNSLHVKLWRN